MLIYKKRWRFLSFSFINIIIFLLGNVLNKKVHGYKIYPSDISFSIIFGGLYGFILAYLITVYFDQQKETEKLDFEVQASLEQLEAFNEELIAQNGELESFANIILDKEKELKEIIDLSPMQIFLKDHNGRYLLCNKSHANFVNMKVEEILGKKQSEIEFFPKSKLEKYSKTDKEVIKNNSIYEYTENIKRGKKELFFKIFKIPIELSDDLKEILVIAQDVTDLKDMELEIEEKNKILVRDNKELSRLNDETNRLADDFEKVIKLITGTLEFNANEEYLVSIFELALNLIKVADSGSIFLFHNDEVDFIETRNIDKEKLINKKIKKNDFIVPNKNKVKVELNVEDFLLNKIKNSIRMGFYYGNQLIGGMSLDIRENDILFSDKDIRLFKSIGVLVNNHFANKRVLEVQGNTQNSIIISLVKMLELFDEYTKGHSEEVAELSKKLAIKMNIKDVSSAYWAGMVHDIGKILVDRKILNKKGRLNFEEYEQIKMHPYWGNQVLSKSEELKDIAKYVLHHHERYDGLGYPDGLKGEEIPKISQILTVVDSWHTMRSRRAYKAPLSIEEAKKELIENKGLQFSEEVVDIFINKILEEENITLENKEVK